MGSPDDVAARGASIFERLRAESALTPVQETPADELNEPDESHPAPDEPQDEGLRPDDEDQSSPASATHHAPSDTGTDEQTEVAGGVASDVVDRLWESPASPETTADAAPLAPPRESPEAPSWAEAAPEAAPAASVPASDTVAADAPAPREARSTAEVPEELARASFARPLPRVLAVANQKGGVGKTTTAVNLGAALAELGFRVLIVDLDPQGNATTGLGINARNLEASIYDVMLREIPIEDCVEPTSLRNLFVAPATIDLAGAEIELVPVFSRELRLRRAIDGVRDDFDFVLIDCPPSLGLLTVNGLAAATEVLVPIQCEYYALEGLGALLRNVNLVQSSLNPNLELTAIVLTMYDARTKLAEQVALDVREHFGDKVCRVVVPRTVRLSEAPSYGQPIILFDSSSRGALAYRELAKEVSGGAPERLG